MFENLELTRHLTSFHDKFIVAPSGWKPPDGGPTNGPWVGAGYDRQPVITGHRPQKWCHSDSETKQKKSFKICFQMNLQSLCLNYNLVSLSHSETPVA